MSLTARRLTIADAPVVRALRLRGLKEHPHDFAADHDDEAPHPPVFWEERLRDQLWIGVEQDGALIACASLRVGAGRKLRHNAWVYAMYVVPEAQGTGAADVLMEALETEARAAGATRLKLAVREGNARAEGFYRRRGFIAYGREPDSHVVAGIAHASLDLCKILAPDKA